MLNVLLIKQKMREMNMKYKDLSEVLGVHYGTVNNWFRYFRTPTLAHVVAICKVLEMNIDDVIVGIVG